MSPPAPRQNDKSGRLRLWCYECARGSTLDGIVWTHFEERGLPMAIDKARRHFPCAKCGARDCLIVPATARGPRPNNATDLIATWLHGLRSQGKKQAAERPRGKKSEFRLG